MSVSTHGVSLTAVCQRPKHPSLKAKRSITNRHTKTFDAIDGARCAAPPKKTHREPLGCPIRERGRRRMMLLQPRRPRCALAAAPALAAASSLGCPVPDTWKPASVVSKTGLLASCMWAARAPHLSLSPSPSRSILEMDRPGLRTDDRYIRSREVFDVMSEALLSSPGVCVSSSGDSASMARREQNASLAFYLPTAKRRDVHTPRRAVAVRGGRACSRSYLCTHSSP